MVELGVFGGGSELDDNIQHSAEHKHLICIKSNSIAGPKNNQEILATGAEGKLWFSLYEESFRLFPGLSLPPPSTPPGGLRLMPVVRLADVHLESTFSFHFHKWLSLAFYIGILIQLLGPGTPVKGGGMLDPGPNSALAFYANKNSSSFVYLHKPRHTYVLEHICIYLRGNKHTRANT